MEKTDEKELATSVSSITGEELQTWRRELLANVLRVLVGLSLPVVLAGVYNDYFVQGLVWTPLLYLGVYLMIAAAAFWPGISLTYQMVTLIAAFFTVGVVSLLTDGRGGVGKLFLLAVPFWVEALWGKRSSYWSLGLLFLIMGAFAFAFTTGFLTISVETGSTDLVSWIVDIVTVLMLAFSLRYVFAFLTARYKETLSQTEALAEKLKEEQTGLQIKVAERTAELAQRSAQLETAAWVAGETAKIRDVEELLTGAVQLISERFGFYHAGIFLIAEERRYAVLRAASSAGGQQMLQKGHRLEVGKTGIVGHVAAQGEARIALDVGADVAFFDNPYLPATHSEMALPLRSGDKIIGVLDVQSEEQAAFGEADISVLQTLADQLAVAISNAYLFARTEQALAETRHAYGELSRQAWQKLSRASGGLEARYLADDSSPVREGGLRLPITVRGQKIGALEVFKSTEEQFWAVDERALLENLASQLGAALESARLYEDSQRGAARERLTAEITDKMRRAAGIEDIVQTAVDELYQALGTSRAFVRLGNLPAASIASEKVEI
ncbi:MAG: GAF domain-containing protein [Chloroflexota bacterium]|nr:GAF domain-containing protein [Chloroflexota bacterium]